MSTAFGADGAEALSKPAHGSYQDDRLLDKDVQHYGYNKKPEIVQKSTTFSVAGPSNATVISEGINLHRKRNS